MRRVLLFFAVVFCVPLVVSAQSAEWLSEHAGEVPSEVKAAIASSTVVQQPLATNDGLEARVRSYFSDAPLMAEIARCESGFRQFTSSGSALNGGAGGMIGLFQVNAAVHAKYASSIGMDIYSVDGNLAYARKLYQEEGTDPWLSSFGCWHGSSPASQAQGSAQTGAFTKDLVLGVIDPEVLSLQKLLNSSGFTIATEGPGSPGQETAKYGLLTREAVRRFQCAKNITCAGDEHTTGFGFVGASTRAALSVLASGPNDADREAKIASLLKQIAELTAQLSALKQKLAMQ